MFCFIIEFEIQVVEGDLTYVFLQKHDIWIEGMDYFENSTGKLKSSLLLIILII